MAPHGEPAADPGSRTKTRRMRELIAAPRLCVSPGVYDGYSALLAEKLGFETCSTTGAGLANSRLAAPDMGIMSMLENVEACRHLARNISIPMMADADTGYGNAVTVFHVVPHFEEAGVAGINIEDQVIPKRCGHMKGKELVPALEMAKKIEAAVRARRDPDFVVNARTDAIAVEGIERAIERARIYAAAGADMIFPDAIRSEDQIRRFVEQAGIPVSVNIGFGLLNRPTTPLIGLKRLEEIGVARVSVPRLLPAAAISGMMRATAAFRELIGTDAVSERPDLVASMETITSLIGEDRITDIERMLLLGSQVEARYGTAAPPETTLHDGAKR